MEWWWSLPVGTVFDITSKFKDPTSTAQTAATPTGSKCNSQGNSQALEPSHAPYSDLTPNFIAEFNYISKEVDEINLEKGDMLFVEDKGTDNW